MFRESTGLQFSAVEWKILQVVESLLKESEHETWQTKEKVANEFSIDGGIGQRGDLEEDVLRWRHWHRGFSLFQPLAESFTLPH